MAIRVRNVGHVVLKVRDIERSARFYCDVLGLKEVARGEFGRPMAFFSTGDNHHDVAVMAMGPDAPAPPAEGTGLYHVALRIGTTLDELRAAWTSCGRPARTSRPMESRRCASGTTWSASRSTSTIRTAT